MLGWICNGFELLAWAILLYHLLICEYSDTPPLCYCFEGVYCELLSSPSGPMILFIFLLCFSVCFCLRCVHIVQQHNLIQGKALLGPKNPGCFGCQLQAIYNHPRRAIETACYHLLSRLHFYVVFYVMLLVHLFLFRGSPYFFATTTHT